MGKRKWTLIQRHFRPLKTAPFSGKAIPVEPTELQKKTKFTVEEYRSSATVNQLTAEKPWQTLSSCKPYHDTETLL